MGRYLKTLLAVMLFVPFLAGSAAAYQENVEVNQQRAYDYILLLKDGYRPAEVKRPVMQSARTSKGKYIRRQLIKGMDKAEELALLGLNDRIPDPVWIYEENWIYSEEPEEDSRGY